jgi:hypothetical protein
MSNDEKTEIKHIIDLDNIDLDNIDLNNETNNDNSSYIINMNKTNEIIRKYKNTNNAKNNNDKDDNENKESGSNEKEENKESGIDKKEENKDIDAESNVPELDVTTYTIDPQKMISDFQEELHTISDKSTIYEYHFEKLNKIYDILSTLNLVIDTIVILFGSLGLTDIEFNMEIIIIILAFINGVFTGVLKLFKYKDKITHVGKYMGNLENLKDTISILIKRISYSGISDQEYYRELKNISVIVTSSNSSIFNINSRDYYHYYRRLKQIKENKRNINHEIFLRKEERYNEFSKKHLELLKIRLKTKTKLNEIHNKAKENNIVDFFDSDIVTLSHISSTEE